MSAATVLIVDDEPVACKMATSIFNAEGYETLIAGNGDEMHEILRNHQIDLILLDINLPGKNGLILAREIREKGDIALMFVTGRDNDIDRILGLEIGADDYITKPFNPRELTIRARNLINRTRVKKDPIQQFVPTATEKYEFDGWILETNSHDLISPEGKETRLPRAEFRMLQYFCEHPKVIVTRSDLMFFMMGRELKEHDRTVDVTIRKLRKHLDSEEAQGLIETIFGEGYRFGADVKVS
ncbi:MAG: two-component system response regulator ArcA [Ruminobacter sp.]|jgi:two-component system aerobic respiration control protein ArcA|nr:two-component system response regulator ArcA [Ruminobacter sp.]MBR1924078.1 two-component system response regulator ArcA [Ruminobacter sp.]